MHVVSSRRLEIEAEGSWIAGSSEWQETMTGTGGTCCRSVARVPASRLDSCRRAEPRSVVLG